MMCTVQVVVIALQDSKLKQQACRAVQQISNWLERQHPRILGQTPAEVSQGHFKVISCLCCLYYVSYVITQCHLHATRHK